MPVPGVFQDLALSGDPLGHPLGVLELTVIAELGVYCRSVKISLVLDCKFEISKPQGEVFVPLILESGFSCCCLPFLYILLSF